MTDTIKTPTDAEIDDAYRATFNAAPNRAREAPQSVPPLVRDFARAVLSRWGAAPTGEPVAWRYRMAGDLQWQYTERQEQTTHADEVQRVSVYAPSAQPAELPRVPLEALPPADWGLERRRAYCEGWRDAEAAHGIKHNEGGQDD